MCCVFPAQGWSPVQGPGRWGIHPAHNIVHHSVPLDHATLLFHLKHFPVDLRILACQMAFLRSNGRFREVSGPGVLVTASWISHLPVSTLILSGTECCPINWVEHGSSCYWFSHSGLTWPEAEKYCQLENAHLVVINSREEQVKPYLSQSQEEIWGM